MGLSHRNEQAMQWILDSPKATMSFLVQGQQWWEEQQLTIMLLLVHPLFLFCCFLFSIIFLFKLPAQSWSPKSTNLLPSPPKLPIIGNLHQLGTLVHRTLRDLSQKYGPLMLLHLGQAPTLVVSSAEMATEIMKNQDLVFANRPFTTAAKALLYGCTDIGFAPYGEYWRQIRKVCVLELLSIKRVQSFKFVREEEVSIVVKNISRSCSLGDTINLSDILLALSSNIICRCALGGKYERDDEKRYAELPRQVTKLMAAFSFGDFFPLFGWLDVLTGFAGKLKRVSKELDTFFDKVIDEHLLPKPEDDPDQDDKKDLVDLLLKAQRDNFNLTRNNIKAITLDMFVGATDSSATTMEWAMAELIKNPKLMKKAQNEVRGVVGKKSKVDEDDIYQMDYLRCIVKETLRLHLPAPFLIPRECFKSTKIEDYDIPPNTRVFINAWAIQRDSKFWDNPEEFRPERFINNQVDFKGQDFQFIPFGSGRRGCPGMSFGLAVMEFVLANLLYWFDWELPGGSANCEELDMTEAFGITVNKKIPLHVVPIISHTS